MNLIELVLSQMIQDISNNDLECLEQLIASIDNEALFAYLSDENQKKLDEVTK